MADDAEAPGAATGYWLDDALKGPDHAACLDGTAPLYYHQPGSGSGANKWYIHHEGCVRRRAQPRHQRASRTTEAGGGARRVSPALRCQFG